MFFDDGTLNPMTSVAGQIKGKRKDASGKMVNIGGPGSPEIAWQADTYIAKGGSTGRIYSGIYISRFSVCGSNRPRLSAGYEYDGGPQIEQCC